MSDTGSVLREERYSNSWEPKPGTDRNGVLVMDVTPLDIPSDGDSLFSYVRVATSVLGNDSMPCAGWLTVSLYAVDAALDGDKHAVPGRFDTYRPVYGDTVDHVYPRGRAPGDTWKLCDVAEHVADGSPVKLCCVSHDALSAMQDGMGRRLIALVVYAFHGCAKVTMDAEAVVLCVSEGAAAGTTDVSRVAKPRHQLYSCRECGSLLCLRGLRFPRLCL